MADRVTKKDLEQLMAVLNNRLGRPTEWGTPGNLFLQEAYGNGPRMYETLSNEGAVNEISPRMRRGLMADYIRAMIHGIEYAETNLGGYDKLPRWDQGTEKCHYVDPFGGPCVLLAYHAPPHDDDTGSRVPGWDGAGASVEAQRG